MGWQVQVMVRRPLKTLLSTLALMVLTVLLSSAQSGGAKGDTLMPDLFVSVSEERYRQVMHIGPGTTPGSMLVLTGHDAQEFDASGKRVRISRFPDELSLPFIARFAPTGPQRIVGIKSGLFR